MSDILTFAHLRETVGDVALVIGAVVLGIYLGVLFLGRSQ